ncbi:MAG: hypothetical protein HY319_31240 [Armatimonadetes bacterium]|nr:hypothetical protein [Armatimonadota bacterium]
MFDAFHWNWTEINAAVAQNQQDVTLFLIVALVLGTLGVQALFYPLFYYLFHFDARSAIRWAYLLAFLLAVVTFHWIAWSWLLLGLGLHRSYWVWLIWFLLFCALAAAFALIPKRRYA